MKRTLIIGFLLVLATIANPLQASAHVEETAGTMQILLHSDPHEPKAGQQTSLHFTIDHQTKPLRVTECNCTITITSQGKSPYSVHFNNAVYDAFSKNKANLHYTFPEAGNYTIKITGKPKTIGHFEPFTMRWNYQVGAAPVAILPPAPQPSYVQTTTPILGSILFAAFTLVLLWGKRKELLVTQSMS